MRIVLFILISFSFIGCSKNNGNGPGATGVDSLGTGWTKVTLPASQSVSDIFFISNTTGFIAGGNLISRSIDGGNTWQKVYNSSNDFVNIAMGSATNAIFVTSSSNPSKLLVTSDGGNNFDSVGLTDHITDAFFVSPSIAYAIGTKFWKTTNGGRNWSIIYDFALSTSFYRSLHFLNEQTGWWAGGGGIYNTINGGVSWTPQPSTAFNLNSTGNIFFADANIGYVSDFSSVGKSINGGAAWNKIFNLTGGYHDLHFITSTTGYVTDNQYIYKTTDGGTTWTREVKVANNVIIELHFTDANHGWACFGSGSGSILKYER